MKSRRKQLVVVTLCAWLVAGFAPLLLQAQKPVDEAAYRRISDRLICQCGCNYGLS